ncbi:MAG: heme o synthase [Methylobacteriaceae bacterium]|nr:heme o synthase [Methylobacteriaceae bacterium]
MSDLSYRLDSRPVADVCNASPADFVQLLKPRVMSLVVLSALAGMLLAPGHIHPVIGFASLLAIAVGAGAAGALNMWYDADIDAIMIRTRGRPIPSGRIDREVALGFGLLLAAFAILTLGLVANLLAAALLAFTIFFYIVIYSMWLKRATPQNIVIGGAAGALPPIVAYAAATGSVSIASVVLFAIIFMWTPPHFWALALIKSGDYARAGIPMMPNVKGADHTRLQILIYSVLLAPLGILPFALGFASVLYGVLAAALGMLFVMLAVRVYRLRHGEAAETAAKQLFAFSILYLFLLLAVIVAERGLGLAPFAAQ